jgi:hypothetical protein
MVLSTEGMKISAEIMRPALRVVDCGRVGGLHSVQMLTPEGNALYYGVLNATTPAGYMMDMVREVLINYVHH